MKVLRVTFLLVLFLLYVSAQCPPVPTNCPCGIVKPSATACKRCKTCTAATTTGSPVQTTCPPAPVNCACGVIIPSGSTCKRCKTSCPSTPAPVSTSSSTSNAVSEQGFLTIRNGYFWDTGLSKLFVPHGMSYQSWISSYGQWQTKQQIEYDFREMSKNNINSVRLAFAWGVVEVIHFFECPFYVQ
jgi:hypothetical protein